MGHFLLDSKYNQKEIDNFIKKCKSFEDEKGYISPTFFNDLDSKNFNKSEVNSFINYNFVKRREIALNFQTNIFPLYIRFSTSETIYPMEYVYWDRLCNIEPYWVRLTRTDHVILGHIGPDYAILRHIGSNNKYI